jgi:uncharacterized protein with PQ loop repeat
MVQDSHGLHHVHRRKKIHQKHRSNLPSNNGKKFMGKAIYVVGVFGPIMTIPQLSKIWIYKNASGVSAVSWTAYLIAAIFWLIYGILHKEKPIILTYSLWIILEAFIVVGTLIYG